MFSYYGSKSKLAHLYPRPRHSVIIEPFAGSARYSLLHWEHDVRLYDASKQIVAIWQYLIDASEGDIRSLPDVPSKVNIDEFTQLAPVEKDLIGFHLCRGKARPRKVGHGQNSWTRDRDRIASHLYKVKHWKVELQDYLSISNARATWFIDPPYERCNTTQNGDRYPHSELNYQRLARWIAGRRGQVIACEGSGASYLPFAFLRRVNTNSNNRTAKLNNEFVYLQRDGCQIELETMI